MQWPKSFNEQLKILQKDLNHSSSVIVFVHPEELDTNNKFFELIDYLMDGVVAKQLASGQSFSGPQWLSGHSFKKDLHIFYFKDVKNWNEDLLKYLKLVKSKLKEDETVYFCTEEKSLNMKKVQDKFPNFNLNKITFDL
tara:strand:+ start:64554 stop:64970 length:417 start_codon:yes stop_codon:yes gene_type:complete